EGTTAIQANDLVGRKTTRDGGRTARAIAEQIAQTEKELSAQGNALATHYAQRLRAAREAFVEVVDFVVNNAAAKPAAVFAGSVPYLMLGGNVMAGWQMGRALLVAQRKLTAGGSDAGFMNAKIATATFYADHILTKARSLRDSIVEGGESAT